MLEEIAIGPLLTTPNGPQAIAPIAVAPSNQALPTPAYVSPPADLNPQIGIVVIQYRDQSGGFELSIPNQQQLDAYAANSLKGLLTDESTTV